MSAVARRPAVELRPRTGDFDASLSTADLLYMLGHSDITCVGPVAIALRGSTSTTTWPFRNDSIQ